MSSRIWHQSLFQYLPTKQLEITHYTICQLRGKSWDLTNLVVDYVKEHSIERLIALHFAVMDELEKRPMQNKKMHKPNHMWRDPYYRGINCDPLIRGTLDFEKINNFLHMAIIYPNHNQDYLGECLSVLWEKYEKLLKSNEISWSVQRQIREYTAMFKHFNYNVDYIPKNSNNIIISNRLKELRLKLRVPASEPADMLGVSTSFYYDLETGRKKIKMLWLIKLADFFEVSTDYILKREKCGFSKKEILNDENIILIKRILKLTEKERKSLLLFLEIAEKKMIPNSTKVLFENENGKIEELMNNNIPLYTKRHSKDNSKPTEQPEYRIGKHPITGMTMYK